MNLSWAGEQVPLGPAAPQRLELLELFGGLHTLGDDLEVTDSVISSTHPPSGTIRPPLQDRTGTRAVLPSAACLALPFPHAA